MDSASATARSFRARARSSFWTVAPALLLPPPWRAVALLGALCFAAAAGTLRMAFGGHFLSDTLFAALFTWLVIAGCWRAILKTEGGKPASP